MLLEGPCSHEQADVAAGHRFLHNVVLWRPEIFGGVEDLFGRRDIVGGTSQKVDRACDVV